MKRLGQRAGFEHSFLPYCLRREVETELTGESELYSIIELPLIFSQTLGSVTNNVIKSSATPVRVRS